VDHPGRIVIPSVASVPVLNSGIGGMSAAI